ncbi:MAG: hypothetical protein CME88_07090 [Hirschia sp.]|nr:hypothetical protein [Hirschia sp.]
MPQFIDGISKAPSAAHLCRLVRDTAEGTAKAILKFQEAKPQISTHSALEYVTRYFDGVDYDFLMNQTHHVRNNIPMAKAAREILPLAQLYKSEFPMNWFKPSKKAIVPLSQKLLVPIQPMGVAGTPNGPMVIAGQSWKTISLGPFEFKLWASILKLGVLDNDPDLSDFHWLDMTSPASREDRELSIRSAESVGFFDDNELSEIISNIEAAMMIVANTPRKKREKKRPQNPNQGSFFD